MSEIVPAAAQHDGRTLALLEAIVRHETPTNAKESVDRLVDFLERETKSRNASTERLVQSEYGDLLVARWPGDTRRRPILVMTHIDTVWPLGTIERIPWRRKGAAIHGPGVFDMKASVAMMLTAVDVLHDLGLQNRPIVWLINTDEEVGSPVSRPVLEALALESEYVLCLEPPIPPLGALKTQRKGVGMFTLVVEGRASHAGADHSAGINAIEELAQQIQWLHSLSDPEQGTTVNVGVISGGTKRNVVPAEARAEIDLRVSTMSEADRIVEQILGAQPRLPGAVLRMTGGLNRPPMERSPAIIEAFERAREIGTAVGLDLLEGATGGGSDGNFTAALGVATLDGLGCPGDGGHADHEHIIADELPRRTALLTALLAAL